MRPLGFDPVADTRRTFRALLRVMSRPGTVERVPRPADRAVIATLVDHEITVSTDDERLAETLADQGRLASAPPREADVVHVLAHDRFDVRECKRGTLVEPATGATVVYRVEDVRAEPGGEASPALTTARLCGPGVDGETTLSVSVSPEALRALGEVQSSYPRGVDAIFAAPDRLGAIPRSTTLELASNTTTPEAI